MRAPHCRGCSPGRRPRPVGGRLRLATWNLENLHTQDGQATYIGSDPPVKRTAIDYQRIRCDVRLFDPDILAVQEVDGEAAFRRVVDTEGILTAGSISRATGSGPISMMASPPNTDLTTLTQDMPVSYRGHTFTEFIDRIVVDPRVVPWVDRTAFRHVTYRQADTAV